MGSIFSFIHKLIAKYRWTAILLFIGIIALSVLSITRLHFVEDISRILPETRNTDKLKYVLKESTLMNKIVFDIHYHDERIAPDSLVKYATDLSNFLESDSIKPYFRSLQLKIADEQMLDMMDVVERNLPLFLDTKDYAEMATRIDSAAIRGTVEAGYKNMISPMGFVSSKYFLKDPFGIIFLALEKAKTFNLSESFKLFKGRVITNDKVDLLLFANLSKKNNADQNRKVLTQIEDFRTNYLRQQYSAIDLEVFGGAVVAEENAQRIKMDVAITMLITLILLMLLIAYFFRRKRAVFVIFVPTLLGSLLALGLLSLFREEISIISLAIGAVLLGMSVDFSLHVYSHYRENHSMPKLFAQVSDPISLSAATTIVAFLSLKLVHSEVLNDLGIFAALSILFSSILALTLLPVLIKSSKVKQVDKNTFLDKMSRYDLHNKPRVMMAIIILTVVFFFIGDSVGFDSNMMHSNYMSENTARMEQRVNGLVGRTNKELYIISMAKSMDDVLAQNHELNNVLDSLQNLGYIEKYSTVTKLLKSEKEQKLAIEKWNLFWQKYYIDTKRVLDADAKEIGFKSSAFNKFEQLVGNDYQLIDEKDKALLNRVILNDFIIESDSLKAAITVLKVDDPKKVKSLIDAHIQHDEIWVYNGRLYVANMIEQLNHNMSNLVGFSLLFVFLILLLYFGRIELTLITMLPIIFGYIWTLGLMSLLGIEFNIFNIIVLSFIFGLGIDYGIFVTKGILQKYTQGIDVIKEYKSSILLSFFTTIIGIGALIFAQHPAMRSIAVMAIIGIFSTLIVTFTIQPWVLNFILYNKGVKRQKPVTFTDFLLSVLALLSFVSGSIILTVFSFVLRITPFATKGKKKIFHKLLQAFSWWMIYADVFNKKQLINPNREDFSKPAVIIANHQSHIDVMIILLLSPKLLILTNDREYHSKLYGKVLQYADFVPVNIPHIELLDILKKRVEQGYSIVVFPEGTRSHDGVLRKFQRGAFHLARELKLEILPVIIHGTGARLSKDEFFLRRGQITTKFLDRIDLSDGAYGNTLFKQSKNVYKIFNEEYLELRKEIETPKFFRNRLVMSYFFRSPVIEWYMKIKTMMEHNYEFFDDLIPRDAKVSDLGCGYGFLIHTLAQTAENRRFIGIDFDEEKVRIAANTSLVSDRTRFEYADLSNYDIEPSDVIIINDVLHYLSPELRHKVVFDSFAKLNDNGFIIIRDGDREMKEKHKVTRFSEIMSTFIKFNKADFKDLDFLSRSEIVKLADDLGAEFEIIDNTQFTSNIIYIFRKTNLHE